MGFGWAGAAAGAQEAIKDIRRQQAEQERLGQERELHGLRVKALMAQLGAGDAAEKRAARDQQLQEAAIALQQGEAMGQGAELSAEIASLLGATPYGARVEQRATLPSRSLSMPIDAAGTLMTTAQSDPGGRQYATLRPTDAQMREQGQRSAAAAAANDPSLPPLVRRFVGLRQAGVPIPNPESLETPDERDRRAQASNDLGFRDFTRRADYQAGITERARSRALQDAERIRPRDRMEAYRLADAAASDHLESLKDESDFFPADMQVDPEAIRQQFINQYLGALQPGATAPASTRKIVEGLRQRIQPTRTGRMTSVDSLIPIGPSRPAPQRTGASDPYEQYLTRTGQR